jgi:splicing factor 3B subunit 2
MFCQRYGPPPSYPHLKIPGLNAPIPPGASFGYHPGGWGKPPVDEVSLSPLISSYVLFLCAHFCVELLLVKLVSILIISCCVHEQLGRPLYGDVFGVHQQEQPNYEVLSHRCYLACDWII